MKYLNFKGEMIKNDKTENFFKSREKVVITFFKDSISLFNFKLAELTNSGND